NPEAIAEAKAMLKAFVLENKSPEGLAEKISASGVANRAVLALVLAPLNPEYLCSDAAQKTAVESLRTFFGMRNLIHEKTVPELGENALESVTAPILTNLHSMIEGIQKLQEEADKTPDI